MAFSHSSSPFSIKILSVRIIPRNAKENQFLFYLEKIGGYRIVIFGFVLYIYTSEPLFLNISKGGGDFKKRRALSLPKEARLGSTTKGIGGDI